MNAHIAPYAVTAEMLRGFQRVLMRCPTASDRKELIMAAHAHGGLTDDEAGLLITAMMLETA